MKFNNNIYIPLTKPITALAALRPSISPISIGTGLPDKSQKFPMKTLNRANVFISFSRNIIRIR